MMAPAELVRAAVEQLSYRTWYGDSETGRLVCRGCQAAPGESHGGGCYVAAARAPLGLQ